MEVKDTLLMPKTAFPMRGNLPNKEPDFLKRWEEMDLYRKVLKKNEDKPAYVLHDGPPYANGNIHIGHAMNKILKDFIVKYKNMNGFKSNFVPGWDTHGLPIEQVLVNNGVDRKSMPDYKFRNKCKDYALKQVDKQREDFKKLGVIGDWDNPYVTLDPKFEAEQIRVFGKMVDKGYIYKGLKPIYWSPSSESALAEAEIEYHDHVSPSIYVGFELLSESNLVEKGTKFVIWTTTPWTLPANVAIAVNKDYTYSVVEANGQKYLVAKDLVEKLADEFSWENYKIVNEVLGSELELLKCKHPFMDRESTLILADHVTLDAGTGLVHTAPGHGVDDYNVGHLQYKLPVISPVDNQGVLTEEAGQFAGKFVFDANQDIIAHLEELGVLLKQENINHSYPHDWRSKKPIIFRSTPQWFCSIDAFRDELLGAIDRTKFYSEWGKPRLYNMIRDRGDWVISRQRVWGVPIPVFYTEAGNPILDADLIEHVAKIFEVEGSNAWFGKDALELLPEGYSHPESPNGLFTKEMDIMDVWFDSGTTHQGVLASRPDLTYPADLYLEGSDQYRGWFNSSLINSVAVSGEAPYKELVSAGFVMDGNGRKMSKSLGNVISPNDVGKQLGAEIIRLWTSSVDYTQDVRISNEILKQVSESYRKLRNTYRFLLGNLFNGKFDNRKDLLDYQDLLEVDRYMLIKFEQVVAKMLAYYENYQFNSLMNELTNFFNVELSSFYLDYGKDILYIESEESHVRRSMLTVLYTILSKSVRLIAPILSFTAEEVYDNMPFEDAESVHLTDFPQVALIDDKELEEKWDKLLEVRDDVLKALEESRSEKVIGKSLEADVKIFSKDAELVELLKSVENLHQLFIVSKVSVEENTGKEYDLTKVDVKHAEGHKCERCWTIVDSVDQDGLCPRCHSILKG
ncbi:MULTISPECIES: isoleucine--tRNA ligase [unclassified Gemella]|uniref:isoleucine--tRNA ligase n=1 Tax=unclassified Gemella TaxID=2624949 RepID=UPI001073F66A|nr:MULTISPECIES: isoleucine--tRNA ligase [unclassified Gemella]MBF0710541.1 isoleucine--tRNA ligase [Gemella sp. GL1.1]MBF0747218.1 isoleucine--tRNA ligase [Gemella sp. 19428wG2_WT2a]NYS27885.1 isoleucine--tRNA ligase [Gemella sp. GL1]TFU58012.1 isoleucine--tRNA ligase [Gemella sp. WT2a]